MLKVLIAMFAEVEQFFGEGVRGMGAIYEDGLRVTQTWFNVMHFYIFVLVYKQPPFYSRDTAEMYEHILHKSLRFRSNVASSAARNILDGVGLSATGSVKSLKEIVIIV